MWLKVWDWRWRVPTEELGLELKDCDRGVATKWLQLENCDWKLVTEGFATKGLGLNGCDLRDRHVGSEVLWLKGWDRRVTTECLGLKAKGCNWRVVTEGLQHLLYHDQSETFPPLYFTFTQLLLVVSKNSNGQFPTTHNADIKVLRL